MITFEEYPHVKDLIIHYSASLKQNKITDILESGIASSRDAELLSKFIWSMADQMSDDCNAGNIVLGREDNSDMLPDVEYEITLHLENAGYIDVWDRISDEENP